jgi:DNA-binding NarL/FixJ family response regulator
MPGRSADGVPAARLQRIRAKGIAMDAQRALMPSVSKAFPTAVLVLAFRETLCREGVDERLFELAIRGATKAPLSEIVRICQNFLDQRPALRLNKLLLPGNSSAASESPADVTDLLRQSGYSSIIGNVRTAADGGQALLLALDVCKSGLQDRGQIERIEKTFRAVTTAAFQKTAYKRQLCRQPAQVEPELTPREQDVLAWLRQGKSNWVISQLVGISEHTVKHIVSVILQKYSVTSRYELLDHARADNVAVQADRAAKRCQSEADMKRETR